MNPLFLIFLLKISHRFYMAVQVRHVGWPIKHSNIMVSKSLGSGFGTVGRCQVLLGKEIRISIKLVSRWKHKVLQNLLVDGCIDFGLDKTQCFCFRSGLVALFLKTSERGDSWCTDSSFSSLLVKLSQVFEMALLDSILKLAVIPVAWAHFPTQFLPSSQLCIYYALIQHSLNSHPFQ